MRVDYQDLEVHSTSGNMSAGAGAAVDTQRYQNLTIQVNGTFSATITIEGTLDGTNWNALDTFTANGIKVMPAGVFKQIRTNVTAFTSATGIPTVRMSGFNTQTL